METLACIAQTENDSMRAGPAAVRAIFALATNDAEIREQLLRLVSSPATASEAHRTACQLLVYVENDSIRMVMRENLRRDLLTSRWQSYFEFFRNVGDPEFVAWLETEITGKQPGILPAELLNVQRRYIQIQQHVADLLAYLNSEETEIDRAWVVRQALRRGAPIVAVRDAVLLGIGKCRSNPRCLAWNMEAVHQCDEASIFRPVDEEFLAPIRKLMHPSTGCGPSPGPPWATPAIQRKRADFYHLTPTAEPPDKAAHDHEGERK